MMTRRTFIAAATLIGALGAGGHRAYANDYVNFGGGAMKNLYINLVFWGKNCAPYQDTSACFVQDADPTVDDRQRVFQYVRNLESWFNGGYGQDGALPPVGLEPAVHYYGLSGITPGWWLNDYGDIPASSYFAGQGNSHFDDGNFRPIVTAAQNGDLGAAYDFQGNVASWSGLPASPNWLTLVVTKGTNNYCISAHRLSGCEGAIGYHDTMNGNPFGAVMIESMQTFSHEIMEAMSDPIIPGGLPGEGTGWHAQNGYFSTNEFADECENIGDTYSWLTVDPIYRMAQVYTPATSCRLTIPEQHAPMAATFEYGRYGAQPLNLFYVSPDGHVRMLSWTYPGQPLSSGPTDYGQPSPTVKAVGKPAAVFDLYAGGEYVFVKGSDRAVWMRNNDTWTSLGGEIYGDPSAVAWNWGGYDWVHVAVLGLDDRLWVQGVYYGSGTGWGQVPGSTLFSGSPTIVSRAPDTLDVFQAGENGQMQWIQYSTANDWTPAQIVNSDTNYNPQRYYPYMVTNPFISTPAYARIDANSFEVIGAYGQYLGDSGMWLTNNRTINSDPWLTFDRDTYNSPQWVTWVAPFLDAMEKSGNNMYTLQGTPAIVASGNGRVDVFATSRGGELWWFYSTDETTWYSATISGNNIVQNPPGYPNQPSPPNVLPLVGSGVTGDPIAITRNVNQVEVFYRTELGSLAHMMFDESNNTWDSEPLLAVLGDTVVDDPAPGEDEHVCFAGGWWMHCCPPGYVMVGADVSSNAFKCAPLITNLAGARTGDSGTMRNGVHSCPEGSVMAGLRADADVLACVTVPNNGIVTERIDPTILAGTNMHVCGEGSPTGAMAGIDVANNVVSCGITAQIQ